LKNKLILVLVFFLFLKSYAENIVYEIGPNTEDVIVFTASRTHNNEATSSTKLLEDFAKKLEHEILKLRVIIIITDNDTPDLPETVGIKKHQNTQKIISMIAQSKSSVVFILSDGPSDKVILTPGAANKTSPPWMIEDIHFALKKQNIPFNLKYNNIILYRLGIINDDILVVVIHLIEVLEPPFVYVAHPVVACIEDFFDHKVVDFRLRGRPLFGQFVSYTARQ